MRHATNRGYRERSFSPTVTGLPNRPPIPAQYGSKDPVSGDQGTEAIMVDSNLVGLIIGRAGENLRRVEADTQTRVQFMAAGIDGNPNQRQCKITGTRAARENAKAEIARIVEENGSSNRAGQERQGAKQPGSQQPALRTGEDSTQMMVPNRTVGLIIGRGGETIRDLQERSGCHVNIVGEDKSINGLRPVNLIGTKEAAAIAKELILEIVDSDNKSMGQGANAGRTQPSNETTGDKIHDSITVPSEAVGMIIGKGRVLTSLTLLDIN
jgi:far upstream element-binding protein